MEQDLDKAFSALRLVNAEISARGSVSPLHHPYQSTSKISQNPYSYNTSPSSAEPQCRLLNYDRNAEIIYANVEELRGARGKPRLRDPEPAPYIPPPEQFSQNLVQIAHVPTQSKVSLEEAMRYTPPNMQPSHTVEHPVYENIQMYSTTLKQNFSSPKQVLHLGNTQTHQSDTLLYQPIPSTLYQTKTNAYLATYAQPLQQSYVNPKTTTAKCEVYLPPLTNSVPDKLLAQQQTNKPRFAQPSPPYSPVHNTSFGSDKSPQHGIKVPQKLSVQTSPLQSTSAGSSPKIPLAAIPSKKVISYFVRYFSSS